MNDAIDGGAGDDVIYGADGDDVIHGGTATIPFTAAMPRAILWYWDGDNALYGGEGIDYVIRRPTASTFWMAVPATIRSTEGKAKLRSWSTGAAASMYSVRYLFPTDEGGDTVMFGEGITPDDLRVQIKENGDVSLLAVGIGNDDGMLIEASIQEAARGRHGWLSVKAAAGATPCYALP